MGFGTNQTIESLAVFVRSARAVWSREEADIFLVTNRHDGLEDLLVATGTNIVSTTNNWHPSTTKKTKAICRTILQVVRLIRASPVGRAPEIQAGYYSMLEAWHHPQLARWFAYSRILDLITGYSHVVLADTKDVVFQDDVFAHAAERNVSLFEDGESFLANGSYNARWYIDAFGQAAFDQVKDRQPICIGVVVGEIAALRRVVSHFIARIARAPFGKIEQAIFNQMVFTGEFGADIEIRKNLEAVATLANEDDAGSLTAFDGVLLGKNGRPVPVVHMYDRFPKLHAACALRYGISVAS